MIEAVGSLTILGLALGAILGYASRIFKVESDPVAEQIEGMLPGSNCGQCGFTGCSPAAEAVAAGNTAVTMCPPGGKSLAQELARLLNVDLDLSSLEDEIAMLASVQEETCIGCAKCSKVCPTDAIVGAPKQIHAVIMDACTGCKACIDVCPTECLIMLPVEETLKTWHWHKPMPEPIAA